MTSNAVGPSVWRAPAMRPLALLTLLGFTSFFLTLASLPAWAVDGGVPVSTAGLVTAVMLTSTVLVQGLVPRIAGRLGLGTVFAAGLIALGAPAPFYLLSQDLWWLLVVSAVRGAGFAVITVLGATFTARIAPPGRRGEAIGIYGLCVAVPNLLAIPGGVALTLRDQFGWVAVLSATPLLALPLVRAVVAGARGDDPGIAQTRTRRRSAVLAVIPPSLVLLVVTLAGGGLVTFLPIERPDGLFATSVLLVFGVAAAAARWQAGTFADRVGTRALLPVSMLAAVVGLVMVALALWAGYGVPATALAVGGAAVFGAGYGAVQNLSLLVAFSRTTDDNVASAVWNICFDSGTGLGALAVGLVAVGTGLPWAYVLCAVVIALALPLAAVGRR